MNPRLRAALQLLVLIGVVAVLFLVFPKTLAFAEMAARELRYLWWLILVERILPGHVPDHDAVHPAERNPKHYTHDYEESEDEV